MKTLRRAGYLESARCSTDKHGLHFLHVHAHFDPRLLKDVRVERAKVNTWVEIRKPGAERHTKECRWLTSQTKRGMIELQWCANNEQKWGPERSTRADTLFFA